MYKLKFYTFPYFHPCVGTLHIILKSAVLLCLSQVGENNEGNYWTEKSQAGFQFSCSALISLIAVPPQKKNLDENNEWFCSVLNSGKNCSKVAMEQDQYQIETEGGGRGDPQSPVS